MRWLAYPLLVVATLAGSAWAAERGVGAAVLLPASSALAAAALLLLERLRPYSRAWAASHGDLGTDVGLVLLQALGSDLLTRVVPMGAVLALAARCPLAVAGAWPERWPLLAQAGLAALAAELYTYWLHRLMHRTRWLWRLHAIHHSVPRVYWLNALHLHPLDSLLSSVALLVPAALGCGPEALAVAGAFFGVHGLLQHANVELEVGPLNWLFSTPDLHRWHHSRVLAESDGNFGGALIVWDVLFGTRLEPPGPPPEDVGLAGLPGFPTDLAGQVLAPFRGDLWERAPSPASGRSPPPGGRGPG